MHKTDPTLALEFISLTVIDDVPVACGSMLSGILLISGS